MAYRELTYKEQTHSLFRFEHGERDDKPREIPDALKLRRRVDDAVIDLALRRTLREPWETKD